MALVLAVSGGFLYLRLRADLLEAVDSGLESQAAALRPNVLRPDGSLGEGGGLIDPGDAFAQVLGTGAVVIQSSPGLRSAPLLTEAEVAGLRGPRFLERDVQTVDEEVEGRLLAVPVTGGRILVVGASLDDQHEALARLAALMAVGGPLVLILAGGVGWIVAGAALRRARSSEELEAALRSAADEAERLARLAEDLLVLARADRGRVPVRREEVDLAELVGGEVDAFAARARQADISIEARVPDGLRSSVDPLRMRQAVGNLLDNAVRSTPPLGTVTIEVVHADGFLSLEVRDSGEGFPAAFLRNAFEPFARPDPSRSRPDADEGSGLGLAIVRAVAEAHGGTVEAANRPGGGAAVTLLIPDERLSSSAHDPLTT